MKLILSVFAALLVASCSPLGKDSAKKGQAAPEDEEYSQALEYYTLTHEGRAAPISPVDKQRQKRASVMEKKTALRILHLQEALRAWKDEKPDNRVAANDRKEIDRIIEDLFLDPASRARMVIKTRDLKLCERVTTQFYNKNRCFVNIMFYDRGPMAQAGLALYLFKYEGKWDILYRVDWIG